MSTCGLGRACAYKHIHTYAHAPHTHAHTALLTIHTQTRHAHMLIHTHSYACTPHKHTHTHVLQTVHWNAHWAGWLQAAAIGQEVFLRELPAPCPPPSRSLLCRVCEKNCYASKHAGTVTVVSGPWKNATQACRHCPCCVGYVKEIAMQACTHCHCRVRYSEKRYASTLALSLFFRVCERNCYASMQALSLL